MAHVDSTEDPGRFQQRRVRAASEAAACSWTHQPPLKVVCALVFMFGLLNILASSRRLQVDRVSSSALAEIEQSQRQTPSLFVGIVTWNRKEYVEMQAESLRLFSSRYPEWKDLNIRFEIFDDGSNEFTRNELLMWYPMATRVHNMRPSLRFNPGGHRANEITRKMYNHFLTQTEYDWILTADSDMLFHPSWLARLLEVIVAGDDSMVVSLYNSCMHSTIDCNMHLCRKEHTGNAGSAWSRKMLERINVAIPFGDNLGEDGIANFDWVFSKYLADNGISMYALRPSMLEHLGVKGSNFPITNEELSRDFPWMDIPFPLRGKLLANLRPRPSCLKDKMDMFALFSNAKPDSSESEPAEDSDPEPAQDSDPEPAEDSDPEPAEPVAS